MRMHLTQYHAKYIANELTKRSASDSIQKLASTLVDAQVDLNPHQVEAALFAFRSPLSKGAILADEVGLRELLDSISSKLMNLLKVEHLGKNTLGKYDGTIISKTVDPKTLLNNIKQLAIVRNWVGAHFNYDGSTVSDADVEKFGNMTLELSELITCPDSGNFPDRNKSGSYWETKNGSIRLHPLQEP